MLLGWILDYILVYLFRNLRQLFRLLRSRYWPRVPGTIDRSTSSGQTSYPFVDYVYSYAVEGKVHIARYRKGFYHAGSADIYARMAPPGTPVTVRYRPTNPDDAVVTDLFGSRNKDVSGVDGKS